MKKLHPLLSVLFLISVGFGEMNSIQTGFGEINSIQGGGGLGYSKSYGFNVTFEFDGKYNLEKKRRDRYFVSLYGDLQGKRNDDNTYDFNEDLFEDKDLGKHIENFYLVGGFSKKISEKQIIYYGGGVSSIFEYFKREDDNEILGSEGIYFVEDDDRMSYKPTITIGFMSKVSSNQLGIKKSGLIVNLNPMIFNLVFLW